MFKRQTNSNDRNHARRGGACGFEFSSSNFEFVSDFGFRISNLRRRRAFSFTEIMFAVIILGIGFIMVAAIFPVALQQAKTTSEETTAAAMSRGTAGSLERIFRDGPRK